MVLRKASATPTTSSTLIRYLATRLILRISFYTQFTTHCSQQRTLLQQVSLHPQFFSTYSAFVIKQSPNRFRMAMSTAPARSVCCSLLSNVFSTNLSSKRREVIKVPMTKPIVVDCHLRPTNIFSSLCPGHKMRSITNSNSKHDQFPTDTEINKNLLYKNIQLSHDSPWFI